MKWRVADRRLVSQRRRAPRWRRGLTEEETHRSRGSLSGPIAAASENRREFLEITAICRTPLRFSRAGPRVRGVTCGFQTRAIGLQLKRHAQRPARREIPSRINGPTPVQARALFFANPRSSAFDNQAFSRRPSAGKALFATRHAAAAAPGLQAEAQAPAMPPATA